MSRDKAVEAAAMVIAGNVTPAQMAANPEEAEFARETARAALDAASAAEGGEAVAWLDPALAYQRAEDAICECGAAGSGEGHSSFCPWLGSQWLKWGNAFNASPQRELEERVSGEATDVADALDEFADIDEAEGGNPHVIATERRAAQLLRGISGIAWECKDFADGWIKFASLAEALEYQEQTGCVMRPARAALNPSAGEGDKL